MFTTTTSRKVLIPLATLVAAGAVAVGSGATWTSTTSSSVSVTSGTLLHTNTHKDATLTLANIKPGDSMSGQVVVENTGTVDSKLDFTAGTVASTFSNDLTITVKENGVTLYTGSLNAMSISQPDLVFPAVDVVGTTADEDNATYDFTVALAATASGTDQNVDQGKSAGVTFTWTQTQVAGETLVEKWVPGV